MPLHYMYTGDTVVDMIISKRNFQVFVIKGEAEIGILTQMAPS